MTNQIIPGSLSQIAAQTHKTIAETFLSAEIIILVDTSGSMDAHDSRGGDSRYNVACEELRSLQKSLPGKIAVFSFSSDTEFCPSGIPIMQGLGTNMGKALETVKVADLPGMKFVLISDGQPDDEAGTLRAARAFINKIDTVFVGPEDDSRSREFLRKLAEGTGGQSTTTEGARELAASVKYLLNG